LTTYVTTDELSGLIKYDVRTIRERLIDSVLIEGRHYFRPFAGRKILFIWEQIEEDMRSKANDAMSLVIPMANGANCDVPTKASRLESVDRPTSGQRARRSPKGHSSGIPMANGVAANG
jgi:hypothetical protein